jgi:hypothetical protein
MTSSPPTLAVDRAAATPTRRGQRNRSNVPLQTLILRLDGITAGDYLTWCRDPDPPAFDYGLRSISIDADPLGDTISAVLEWDRPVPPPRAAATIAGLPLTADVQAIGSPHADAHRPHASRPPAVAGPA